MDQIPSASPALRRASLLLLRLTIGLLLVWWAIDKFRDPAHGQKVADKFYLGVGTGAGFIAVAGALELALGVAVMAGVLRRVTYPALLLVTLATALGVWRSIIDPWGLVLNGSVVLFFPSIIIFAGSLVLFAFAADDTLVVGRRA